MIPLHSDQRRDLPHYREVVTIDRDLMFLCFFRFSFTEARKSTPFLKDQRKNKAFMSLYMYNLYSSYKNRTTQKRILSHRFTT